MASFGYVKPAIFEREEIKQKYQSHIRGLNACDRHNKFLNDYVYVKGKCTNERLLIEMDRNALREGYRLVRSEEDDMVTSWEQRPVKRFYDMLSKSILCEWMLWSEQYCYSSI